MPIIIFHGNKDEVINHNNSLLLEKRLRPTDKLIILDEEGHNGITENKQYKTELSRILF